MPFEVDPLFQASARHSRLRKRRRTAVRLAAGVLGCLAIGLVVWILSSQNPPQDVTSLEDDGFALIQSEETSQASIELERMNSFVDLRRDPMILRFDQSGNDKTQTLRAVDGFGSDRVPAGRPVIGLRDSMFVAERRLVTTLPSSRDDFALFKAQRSQGFEQVGGVDDRSVAKDGTLVRVDAAGSWGDLVTNATDAPGGASQAAVYVETQIENTTSTAVTKGEAQRGVLFEDDVIVLRAERALNDVLTSAGLSDSESAAIGSATARELSFDGALETGSIVALRKRSYAPAGRLMHMSIYGPEGYIASLAQVGAGRFERAADPWVEDNLLGRSDKDTQQEQPPGEVRLLDALYSAAIRNGIPTKQVGEMIVLMSRHYDLERFVVPGDDLVLLRAGNASAMGLSEVLYVGIHNDAAHMACYVLDAPDLGGLDCFDFDRGPAARRGQGGLGGGFLVPVNGVKTSGFGPRHHPILKQVRNHNGIDWAAPTGTPVLAVADGVVKRAGVGGGFGNLITLDHGDAVETRYAHLNGFADDLRRGVQVLAGDVIGFVGTTGLSTGPHLHFELWVGGRPVDALTYGGPATQAVEALVDRIIRVESGGVATAKNPLSTATGLGQFIESTWLRMMRDYRSDLVRQMGRAQLLALRNDPAMSREMVRHLARENEAFLRARGHRITAGRLYLAHFLGPSGAHLALGADAEASVLSVMGARVVDANPFLRGKRIADLHGWSDRKMRGSGRATLQPRARVIPPKAVAYRKAVDELLSQL